MTRKPLLPWVLLAASLFLFQLPTNPTAGGLPGKIPSQWADRLVELECDDGANVCGVLVAPKMVMTCQHWRVGYDDEYWAEMRWTAVFKRGFLETDRIRVVRSVNVSKVDISFFELESAPRNPIITPIAREEPSNGTFVVVLGSPLEYSHFWTLGIYSGQRLAAPHAAFSDPMAAMYGNVAPGSSGGPVFDPDGRLVGVVSAARKGFPGALVVPIPVITRALDNAGISR